VLQLHSKFCNFLIFIVLQVEGKLNLNSKDEQIDQVELKIKSNIKIESKNKVQVESYKTFQPLWINYSKTIPLISYIHIGSSLSLSSRYVPENPINI
jgi:hypothetical protein